MADLFRIAYISTAKGGSYAIDINTLTKQCQRNNRLHGVTGLLLWSGRSFLQVIEGKKDTLETLMKNIEADTRHHSIVIFENNPIDYSLFTGWAMEVCAVPHMGTMSRSTDEKIDRIKQRISNEQGDTPLTAFAGLFIEYGGVRYRQSDL